jgi:type VI protein secretion system component VasK
MFKISFSRAVSNKVRVTGVDVLKLVQQPGRDWLWVMGGWCCGVLLVIGFGWYLYYQGNDLENVSLVADPIAAPTVGSRKALDATVTIINQREAAYQAALAAPAVADPAR